MIHDVIKEPIVLSDLGVNSFSVNEEVIHICGNICNTCIILKVDDTVRGRYTIDSYIKLIKCVFEYELCIFLFPFVNIVLELLLMFSKFLFQLLVQHFNVLTLVVVLVLQLGLNLHL